MVSWFRTFSEQLPFLYQSVPDPVRLAAELEKPPMVDDHGNHGGRHLVVAEHRAPPVELQVRRNQHRLALVGVG